MLLEDRADPRDRRPLEYPLRLAFPMGAMKSSWHKSSLYVNNRTITRATMLQLKDMRVADDEDSMGSTAVDDRVAPAEKYAQIGESAAAVILESCLESQQLPVCMVLDLSPKTGDLSRAILKKPKSSFNLHYIAVAPPNQWEWAMEDLKDVAVELYLSKALRITGFEPLPSEMSASDAPTVVLPTLNIGTVIGKNLCLPDTVVQKWAESTFKDEWNNLLEEKANVIPDETTGLVEPPSKRARTSPSDPDPLVTGPVFTAVSSLDFTTALLCASGSGKLKGLVFQLYTNNQLFLVNSTAGEIPVSNFVTSWYKGKWWQAKESEDQSNPETDVLFTFPSSSNKLVVDNTKEPVTLLMAMDEMKKKAPEKAILRYHTIKDDPTLGGGPGDFSIEMVHAVYWRAEMAQISEDARKQSAATMAAFFPVHAWNTDLVEIVWHCRWAKQGLTGVKPSVHLRRCVVLPPGQALKPTK